MMFVRTQTFNCKPPKRYLVSINHAISWHMPSMKQYMKLSPFFSCRVSSSISSASLSQASSRVGNDKSMAPGLLQWPGMRGPWHFRQSPALENTKIACCDVSLLQLISQSLSKTLTNADKNHINSPLESIFEVLSKLLYLHCRLG